MIDHMIRCKDLNDSDRIESLTEWFNKCPPEGKEKQWVDGRSAKETAKHWVYTIPSQFVDLLKPFHLKYKLCSPEFVTKFDDYKGNGRNHDLLIIAKNLSDEKLVISVESKVDETFDVTISERITKANTELLKTSASKALNRIQDLRITLFGKIDNEQLKLRYQLLTAIAGTLAEANSQKINKAIFIVQTFVSDEIDIKKHSQNQSDLDTFLDYFSNGQYKALKDGNILGPLRFHRSTKYISGEIDLWIGKYSIKI
jgi:hypothetical protein